MNDEPETDRSAVVPPAVQLTGEALDPDQPDPSEVLPIGGATETEHLESPDEKT